MSGLLRVRFLALQKHRTQWRQPYGSRGRTLTPGLVRGHDLPGVTDIAATVQCSIAIEYLTVNTCDRQSDTVVLTRDRGEIEQADQ